MKKIISFLLLLFITTAIAASAKDIQKIEFSVVPAMHCEKCEAKIKNRLKFERGIKRIDANAKRGTVIVEFDSEKITREKISQSLSKAGYQAKFKDEHSSNNK